MKRKLIWFLTTLALALVVSVPSISAQTTTRATVPFAFMVGQSQMPAGTYTISPVSPSAVAIRDSKTGKSVLSLFRLEQAGKGDDNPKLVFNRYANRYFLSQVSRGFGRGVVQLPTSKLEKEMRIASTGSASAQKTVVAAK